jgi:hypothetical protein
MAQQLHRSRVYSLYAKNSRLIPAVFAMSGVPLSRKVRNVAWIVVGVHIETVNERRFMNEFHSVVGVVNLSRQLGAIKSQESLST